jgi:fatty acid desaturase
MDLLQSSPAVRAADAASLKTGPETDSIRIPYDRERIRSLGQARPSRFLLQIAIEWALIIAAIVLCKRYFSVFSYLAAIVFIAGRQHALGALAHEIVHYHLTRRFKLVNDTVGDIFAAFPLFISIHGYRRQHFAHHTKLGTHEDPDWARTRTQRFVFPKSRTSLCFEIVKCLCGYRALQDVSEALIKEKLATDLPLRVHVLRGLFFAIVIGAIWYWHAWSDIFLFWLVPMNTVFIFLLYWRLVAEHSAIEESSLLPTRTIKAGLLQALATGPNGINYHLEHHMFPQVPFHNLGELHRYLMSIPEYSGTAHVTDGYGAALFLELTERG